MAVTNLFFNFAYNSLHLTKSENYNIFNEMEANNEMKPYVIGLDLGGTNSVFGIVDSRGDIKATTAVKTQAYEKVEDYVKLVSTPCR